VEFISVKDNLYDDLNSYKNKMFTNKEILYDTVANTINAHLKNILDEIATNNQYNSSGIYCVNATFVGKYHEIILFRANHKSGQLSDVYLVDFPQINNINSVFFASLYNSTYVYKKIDMVQLTS
jgi:hypothetical protein